jgi:glutaminyl-tRNA synthetase
MSDNKTQATEATENPTAAPTNFIRQIVQADLEAGRHGTKVVTRFPPEPNGYLHIGHAKSICLNFGIAADYGGRCYMRFDDTNPTRESPEFVDSILRDVTWLGFDWGDKQTYASNYFERLYDCACALIDKGKAYVCDLDAAAMRAHRGTLTEPGTDSPSRTRSVAENLDLFKRMRAGEFADGERVLRARIDMASPNLNMRDPALYRIRHMEHHQTGNTWCIYPMYDFTHCLSDAFEDITHSLCTLEFEDHRPLYDWVLEQLGFADPPRQYEFSRLNLDYTVMSKRRLTQLVSDQHVSGWDDPRMPTLSGMRRRGYTPEAIRDFCQRIGVTRKENLVEIGSLENCVREHLDLKAPRAMAVLNPVKLVITTLPEAHEEFFEAKNHPRHPEMGTHSVPFARELYIERDDFMEVPARKYFRMSPGREVRLRYAYLVTCTDVIKDASGQVVEIHATHDPGSRGGNAPDGRKVKGTIHWVSARHGYNAKVRLYDRLFKTPVPGRDTGEFIDDLNEDSVETLVDTWLEPRLQHASPGAHFQFERIGYFCVDDVDSSPGAPVFNRVVGLRDSWVRRGG